MGVVSLLVINRMENQMQTLARQAKKVSSAQQMLDDVTAQSHYRAMALQTQIDDPGEADGWNEQVVEKKQEFDDVLAEMRREDPANRVSTRGWTRRTSFMPRPVPRCWLHSTLGSLVARATCTSARSTRHRTCSRTCSLMPPRISLRS